MFLDSRPAAIRLQQPDRFLAPAGSQSMSQRRLLMLPLLILFQPAQIQIQGRNALRRLTELTSTDRGARSTSVSASCKFLTVLFSLALWLGATGHCNLEAAGILTSRAESHSPGNGCCAGSADSCTVDGCQVVENGAYQNSSDGATLETPAFSCLCLIYFNVALRPAVVAAESSWGTDFERPLDWVPSWQFVHRAAPSPRAPSCALS